MDEMGVSGQMQQEEEITGTIDSLEEVDEVDMGV